MRLEKGADKVIETEVLVIGGGIAGCCAAAKAREHGLNVTIIEKAHTDRSGSAGQGIDHFEGFFPRDGATVQMLTKTWEDVWSMSGCYDPNINIMYRLQDNSFWAFDELEKLGVPMRWDDGEPYWFPFFAGVLGKVALRVHWTNVKPLLSEAVKKRGVNILQRTMAVDLLTNKGTVVGATAVDIRTGEFIVIKAKATVLATSLFFNRSYDPDTPAPWKYKMNYHFSPAAGSGDGMAMAYRAGAELVNMEMTQTLYRIRDDKTSSYGNFPLNDGVRSKTLTWKGEEVMDPTTDKYHQYEQKAMTPIYHSLEHLSDDFHKRLEVAYVDERMVSLQFGEERGFNPKTHRFEYASFRPLGFYHITGVYRDEEFKTSLRGLYCLGGSASQAATGGLLLGDDLHTFLKEASEPIVDEGQVESQKQVALAPLLMREGLDEPLELESAVRYICNQYVGTVKSEGKLREGLRRIGTLKRVFLPRLQAKNPHYLLGCLEVRSIIEMAELHIQASLERKETRKNFIRLDYPETDPTLDDKVTFQRLDNGKPFLEMKERTRLKPEYAKEGE